MYVCIVFLCAKPKEFLAAFTNPLSNHTNRSALALLSVTLEIQIAVLIIVAVIVIGAFPTKAVAVITFARIVVQAPLAVRQLVGTLHALKQRSFAKFAIGAAFGLVEFGAFRTDPTDTVAALAHEILQACSTRS